MSETGATDAEVLWSTEPTTGATEDQIEQGAINAWGYDPELPDWRNALDEDRYPIRAEARWWAGNLVPPGYQIVPAGAVVLSAEEAELGADGLSRLIARYESLANEHDRAGRTEQWLWERNNAAKYRALAAKLSGGAS